MCATTATSSWLASEPTGSAGIIAGEFSGNRHATPAGMPALPVVVYEENGLLLTKIRRCSLSHERSLTKADAAVARQDYSTATASISIWLPGGASSVTPTAVEAG
jgi:hypothetical protein